MRDLSHLANERQIGSYQQSQPFYPPQQSQPQYRPQFEYAPINPQPQAQPVPEPEMQRMTMADGYWIVFFKGRRTGIVVSADNRSQAITKSRAKKKRGGDAVVSARTVTASEQKTIRNNGWVKSRPPGYKESMRGHGPKPKAAK